MDQTPKVSIITISFNSEKYIEQTIKSVINQTYKNIEYIIIDGNSTDKTSNIIKKYSKNISKIVIEKDDGIFDAMNKGVKLATGDIIGILNSDDHYYDKNVIDDVVKSFKLYNVESIFGDIDIIDGDKIKRKWREKDYKRLRFLNGWHPAHPSFFVKKEIYDKYGYFNLKYQVASDYDLLLRFLYRYKISSKKIDRKKPMVNMRAGGNSNGSIKNIIISNIEVRRSWYNNKLFPPPFLITNKILRKIAQFF